MRPPWMLHLLLLLHTLIHLDGADVAVVGTVGSERQSRAVVVFPDENQDQGGQKAVPAWRFQSEDNALTNTRQSKSQFVNPLGGGNSGLLVPVSGTRGTAPTTEGVKKGRKAAPDVQDIISGIVHLLGGKVNLHAASAGVPEATPAPPVPAAASSSGPSMLLRPQMLSAQSTRINNRAPPRLSEVPFEAIPLEAANSAGSTQQQPQLPFGIPFRPPVWPGAMSQKPGQNVQELPYGTGIPLPVQLVPPVAPSNRPWPPPPPPQQASASSSSVTPSPTKASSSSELATTINFFPEDHGVRHPPGVVLVSTPTPSLPESTIAAVTTTTTTSSLDSIIQSSIEDVVPSSSSQPVSLASQPAVKTTVVPSAIASAPASTAQVVSSSSTVDHQQNWLPPNTTPQLEAGSSSDSSAVSGFTPPLPAARPGQVFHDEYLLGQQQQPPQPGYGYGDIDVITSDNIRPQGAYPDSFELVVSAAQNFGSNNPRPGIAGAPVTGRPYVIPVSIDQVRQQPAAAVPLPADGDEYVSIDGRKTYFNLFPTDVVNGPGAVPVVQPTIMPDSLPPVQQQPLQQQQQQVNNSPFGNYGYAYPNGNDQMRPVPPRPNYPTKSAVPVTSRPTPTLIRRPSSTTPPSRIDACIVGDPNACLEPNESCQAEVDGSACSCKPGFGRKKASDACKGLTGFLMSIRLDRLDSQRLAWSTDLTDPSTAEYQQLEWEANQAINSMMEMIPLSSHYVVSSVNKFYSVGNKVIVNASVFMDQSAETQSVTVRPTLTKQLSNLIGQRNNNLGISRLFVDSTANPITAILDLNECGSPDLNDCSADAECINTVGSFTCECKAGFSDPLVNDPNQVGRQCNSCTRSYCNNRGECSIDKGKKVCQCQGNYKGQQCELDGEVLGVAVGASVAAVIIIILTLVLLCMWSRRWRQNQDKMLDRGSYLEQLKTMPFPALMQDRIRWAQYAEAMASAHNLYAQPFQPPPYFYQTGPSPSNANTSSANSTVSPPPVPPRNKVPIRPTASLPVDLVTSTANQVFNNIQDLARKISRKKRPAPRQPDPVNVNPHLALISPAYAVGTMSSLGRASLAPTLPMVGPFHHGNRSIAGSVHSFGKRSAPPPPPSNPPPALQVMETSEESAAESDAPIAHHRHFQVPRPRSRSSALSSNNIYFEADGPTGNNSNEFNQQPPVSLNTYNHQQQQRQQQAPRYYYR